MKEIMKVALINLVILSVLLTGLEISLRLSGVETIVQSEQRTPEWANRYKNVCEKIPQQPLEVYDRFYTDSEGIFKARSPWSGDEKDKLSINRDGFRGKPFEFVKTSRPKILLIGDSFTWGAAAKPLKKSYADLLEKAGYYVYNAGIPGTDPQQYAMIADKYTAKLKPDIVAVCIYMGNDVSTRPLLIAPNGNLHYVTNYGFLMGYDHKGRFFKNAREAFEYMKKRKCGNLSGPMDYIIYKTVLGKIIDHAISGENRNSKQDGTKKWVTDSLQNIKMTCDKNNATCIFFLIPFVNQNFQPNKSIQKNIYLFEGLPYYYPFNIGKADYCESPNNHFNNQGHRKYADFMISVFKKNGFDAGKK